LAEFFQLSTYFFRVPAAAVRWSIHLLVRIVIAVTCSSPAAAFDAAHLLHTADVMLRHGHSLAIRGHEAGSNSQPDTTGCALGGKSPFAAQQEGEFNQTRQRSSEDND
jgi:hypothetical protein